MQSKHAKSIFMREPLGAEKKTSFHGHKVLATKSQIESMFGKPMYVAKKIDDDTKTQYVWIMSTQNYTGSTFVFTLYDWKGPKIQSDNQLVSWNIGTKTPFESRIVVNTIHEYLTQRV